MEKISEWTVFKEFRVNYRLRRWDVLIESYLCLKCILLFRQFEFSDSGRLVQVRLLGTEQPPTCSLWGCAEHITRPFCLIYLTLISSTLHLRRGVEPKALEICVHPDRNKLCFQDKRKGNKKVRESEHLHACGITLAAATRVFWICSSSTKETNAICISIRSNPEMGRTFQRPLFQL